MTVMVKESICKPECEVCAGSGYVSLGQVDTSHPDFGKVELCPKVDRWSLPSAVRYGLTKYEIEKMDWTGLKDLESLKPLISVILEFINEGKGWLYIWGAYGLGKSYMLKTAVAIVLRRNQEASYVRMSAIMDRLRDGFDNPDLADTRMDWWAEVPFLAIDEFDRLRVTEYAEEQRFLLMDQRYESAVRGDTATIIASNKAPEDLPGADNGYLVDRIMDGRFKVAEIYGESQRRLMK